jgi:hypothetical protein
LLTVVYAQATASNGVKQFSLPKPSFSAQLIQGLTGAQPSNVWFVLIGSYPSLTDALNNAKTLKSRFPAFQVDVYAPNQSISNYSLVIGANLTEAQAQALREKAVAAGMPASYRTFSNLPLP